MSVRFDDDKLGELVESLEEWAAIINMANMLAVRLPPAVTDEVELGAGPLEVWKMGGAMATTLSTECRCELYRQIQSMLVLVRSQLDGPGLSQPRGTLRLAASAGAS